MPTSIFRLMFAGSDRRSRPILTACFCAVLILIGSGAALAQTGGGTQDSSSVGDLRPRWGTYLIPPFPSPARAEQTVTVQFYNHNDAIISCKMYDAIDREVLVIQAKAKTPTGLHTFQIPARLYASGMYFIRLTSYSEAGSELVVDNTRFLIVR